MTLDEAADHYRSAQAEHLAAQERSKAAQRAHISTQTRGTYAAWSKAIDQAADARRARQRARDELVAAALDHVATAEINEEGDRVLPAELLVEVDRG